MITCLPLRDTESDGSPSAFANTLRAPSAQLLNGLGPETRTVVMFPAESRAGAAAAATSAAERSTQSRIRSTRGRPGADEVGEVVSRSPFENSPRLRSRPLAACARACRAPA